MRTTLSRHSEKMFYFLMAAREGSLSAAARKLGMATTSLSASVKDLEAALGLELYQRSPAGLTLTPAGEELLECCRRVFRDLEETEFRISHLGDPTHLRLRVGLFDSLALSLWPSIHGRLESERGLSLCLKTGRSSDVVEALLKREVDVALFVECAKHAELHYEEIFSDEYGFFLRDDETALAGTPSSRTDVQTLTCILLPDAKDSCGHTLRDHLRDAGLAFDQEIALNSFELAVEFVRRGFGIGILPLRLAEERGCGLRRVTIPGIPESFGAHRVHFAYRKDSTLQARFVERLLTVVREAAQPS